MTASRKWIVDAAATMVVCLGKENTLEVVEALQRLPGANQSATKTLAGIHDEVVLRGHIMEAQAG